MPRKRRRDYGSNDPAGPGKRRLRWVADMHDGRGYARHSKTIRGTKKDGDRFLAAMQVSHGDDGPVPTIGQAWDAWFVPDAMDKIAEYERTGKPGKRGDTLKPKSWKQVLSAWNLHVAPRWSDIRASDVKYSDLQMWLNEKTEQTAQRCLSIVKGILRLCLLNGVIDRNVAEYGFRMPTRKQRDYGNGTWSLHTLDEKIWPAVHGRICEPAFIMYAFNGCRSGEGLAPMLEEIEPITIDDMIFASVPILRQVYNEGGVSNDEDLKNKWSPRPTVVPPPWSLRILQMKEDGLAKGDTWLSDNGFGEPISQQAVRRDFYAALDSIGEPRQQMRALRRSWRSWIAARGISPEILEKMMGHVGSGTTGRHYLKINSDLIAEELYRAFKDNPVEISWDILGQK